MKSHLPSKRRFIQLYAALLYNAHLKGFVTGSIYTGKGKILCVPGLNCYSCPGAIGACPLGALQNAIASSGGRLPTYIIGIILLFGLTLGRTICGFLCPVGLFQEFLHKIPTPKIKKNAFTHALSYLKYVILCVFVILIPLWYAQQNYPLPAFCKYICPAGTAEGAVGLLSNPVNADKYPMLGLLFTWKFIVMLLVIAASVFIYRVFCRFLCPLGAIYGLFAKLAIIGVKVDAASCIHCGRCVHHCPMDISHVADHECIHCSQCISVCPTNAIEFKAGKYTISSSLANAGYCKMIKHKRHIDIALGALLSVILAVVLFVVNWSGQPSDASITSNETNVNIPQGTMAEGVLTGSDPGMLAPDFSVPVYGSSEPFILSEHRGKRVIINFWATWCTPCCKELPYFDAAYRQHRDDAVVVAIHSHLVTDDVEAYLANFDYQLPFALDISGEVISLLGGSNMLPQTIVVDENGIITYNAVGSVTPEMIESFLK